MESLDIEFGSKVLQQMLDIWVTPEVRRRQEIGETEKPLELTSAQVIFFPDGRPPLVRINSEVRMLATVKLKQGSSKRKGDPVFANEVESLSNFSLSPEDDVDCGHMTMVRLEGRWVIAFDLHYNKELAKKHLKVARQFYAAAEFSLSKANWAAFADNLFSAAELAARACLLASSGAEFRKKTTHRAIRVKYERFAKLGNVEPRNLSTLDRLSGLRDHARYVRRDVMLDSAEAQALLRHVEDMMDEATNPPDRITLMAGEPLAKGQVVGSTRRSSSKLLPIGDLIRTARKAYPDRSGANTVE